MNNKLATHLSDVEGARKKWGWFFVLGVLLLLLGAWAIGSAIQMSLFSVFFFGVLLVGAGAVQLIQAFIARKWSGFFPSLILSILYIVAGLLCMANPANAALALTFFFAAFCFFSGIVKMAVALTMQFERSRWVFFNGLVTFILGCLIYSEWPLSGLWLIGTFIGVDIFLTGCSWIALALVARKA